MRVSFKISNNSTKDAGENDVVLCSAPSTGKGLCAACSSYGLFKCMRFVILIICNNFVILDLLC